MTVRELINLGADRLKKESDTARLDASLLLSHVLKVNRAKLMALYPESVNQQDIEDFLKLIEVRSQGYPISYIFNEKEFYCRTFYIEEGVLTPRPDTEVLIEKALELIDKYNFTKVLDMCTGTGCIALTIQAERSKLDVTASDISPIAAKVFKKNNKTITDNRVKFINSNLYKDIQGKFDIIVTNPPYLTTDETRERLDQKWKEPELALDGGDDGLDLIRSIIRHTPSYLNCGGYILIEASPWQMPIMEELLKNEGFNEIHILRDLAGFQRVIVGRYE